MSDNPLDRKLDKSLITPTMSEDLKEDICLSETMRDLIQRREARKNPTPKPAAPPDIPEIINFLKSCKKSPDDYEPGEMEHGLGVAAGKWAIRKTNKRIDEYIELLENT